MNQFSRLLILVFALSFWVIPIQGQNNVIDSLKRALENQSVDSLKYEILSELFQETRRLDRNAIVPIGHKILDIARKMDDQKKEARAHNILGFSYLSLSKNDSVIYHSEESNKIAAEINDSSYVISSLNNMALAHQRSNNYELATITYHKVIDGAIATSDYRNAVIGLVNIASVQMEQDNYEGAIEYLDRVDDLYSSLDEEFMANKLLEDLAKNQSRVKSKIDKKQVIDSVKNVIDILYPNVYVNKGLCYVELEQYDEALDAFEKTIAACEKLDASYTSTYITAYANNSIGDIYRKYTELPDRPENSEQANWLVAIDYYQKAYDGFSEIGFDRGLTFTLQSLGTANTNLQNLNEGREQLQQSLVLADELNFTEEKRNVYESLVDNARFSSQFQQALNYSDSFIKYKDQLRNEERDQIIQESEVKYETAQKEKAIAELNYQNELKTKQQRFQRIVFAIGLMTILGLSALIYSRYRYLQQKKAAEYEHEVNVAMNRFVPNEFIKTLGREHILDVKLGDRIEKEITVMFSDIRSFTTISENMTPSDNFEFVKKYAEVMGPIIQKNDGFVSQYLGDGIMAIFQKSPDSALNACVEMQIALQEFNKQYEYESWSPIRVGMGLHTGPLIMGIIGDDQRRDATLISDTVNTAARIESTTKEFGVRILISEDTKKGLKNVLDFHLRRIGEVRVKGKSKAVNIYECLDSDDKSLINDKLSSLAEYEDALKEHYSGNNDAFAFKMKNLAKRYPNDKVIDAILKKYGAY